MRTKKDYTTLTVTKDVAERLRKDRDRFQKTIGGGRWSLSDTIEELYKIKRMKKNR